jgi:ABC-type sugar transport system permease subunit
MDTLTNNYSLKKRLSLFFLEKKNGVAYLLLVPSLVLIFGILIYPLLYSLFISFHDYLLTKPEIQPIFLEVQFQPSLGDL